MYESFDQWAKEYAAKERPEEQRRNLHAVTTVSRRRTGSLKQREDDTAFILGLDLHRSKVFFNRRSAECTV